MSKKQHRTPCKQCPWRKASLPGYLGNSEPLEFLQQSEAETRMPCHCTVDYSREDWQEQVESAPQCAGRAIHFANRVKTPRYDDLLVLPADREAVFTQPQEFLDHHMRGNAPKVLIIGNLVIPQEEKP